MSTISELQKQIHENAKNKGFWDAPFNMGEKLALIHGEVSEALEADRKGEYFIFKTTENLKDELNQEEWNVWFKNFVKDSWQDEMADAVIKILDLCEYKGVDLEWHIKAKMRYNATRPHMHGKKY